MLAALSLACATALNDANYVSFGGAGALVPHKTVHMLGEDIEITMDDDTTHVRVFFSFQNKGPATKVQMAFPFSYVDWTGDSPVRKFASTVDGAVAKTRIVVLRATPASPDSSDLPIKDIAYVKEVSFGSNQRRTVKVEYSTEHGSAGFVLSDTYILKTGATWAGRIGTATITVDWAKMSSLSRPDLVFRRSDGTEYAATWTFVNNKRATTTLTNFEPDFNLDLSCVEGFWDVWINGRRMDSERAYPSYTSGSLFGDKRDPFIPLGGLGRLFMEWAVQNRMVRNEFDTWVEILESVPNSHSLRLKNASVLAVKRGVRDRDGSPATELNKQQSVFLKDFVQAIGGTFKWNATKERIEITLPIPSKPSAKIQAKR